MYTVKWLNDQEFDSLPFPEVETSLGIADPKSQTAYVRRTGINNLDYFNTFHELEHLEEGHEGEHADHFRNGVYYKGFGEIMQTAAPFLGFVPGVGPALALGAGAGGTVMANRDAKKAQSRQMQEQQQQQSQMAMNSFGQEQGVQPVQSMPNVVQTGQSAGGFGSGGGGGQPGSIRNDQELARTALGQGRSKGFYGGR